jgi:hypothetical protein
MKYGFCLGKLLERLAWKNRTMVGQPENGSQEVI